MWQAGQKPSEEGADADTCPLSEAPSAPLLEQVHSCKVPRIPGGSMPFASSAGGGRTQSSDKQDALQILLSPNITSPVCFACVPGVAFITVVQNAAAPVLLCAA